VHVYRPTYTKNGVRRTSGIYWVRASVDGRKVRKSTGCRDKRASEERARAIVRNAERVATRLISPAEEQQARPLAEHAGEFLGMLKAQGVCQEHHADRTRCLLAFIAWSKATTLRDLDPVKASQWMRAYKRDLVAAGLATVVRQTHDADGKRHKQPRERFDTQGPDGRVLDFHSLRYTFVTRLAQAGVHPRTAQALARHAKIETTMQIYTDLDHLDLHAAVEQGPGSPAGLGPVLVQKPVTTPVSDDNVSSRAAERRRARAKRRGRGSANLARSARDSQHEEMVGVTGLEPVTPPSLAALGPAGHPRIVAGGAAPRPRLPLRGTRSPGWGS
jgi:hypothetical protein